MSTNYLQNPAKETVAGQMTGLLQHNSPYIKQARQSGQNYAAKRGLLNSSMAAGASHKAAISAALPIAQQDAKTHSQFALTKFSADQSIRTSAYDVTANTHGAYLSSINKIITNTMDSVNEIEISKDISQANKNAMVKNTVYRRDADLSWTRQLFSKMPTWDMNWYKRSSMPDAPGKA